MLKNRNSAVLYNQAGRLILTVSVSPPNTVKVEEVGFLGVTLHFDWKNKFDGQVHIKVGIPASQLRSVEASDNNVVMIEAGSTNITTLEANNGYLQADLTANIVNISYVGSRNEGSLKFKTNDSISK